MVEPVQLGLPLPELDLENPVHEAFHQQALRNSVAVKRFNLSLPQVAESMYYDAVAETLKLIVSRGGFVPNNLHQLILDALDDHMKRVCIWTQRNPQ